MYIAIVLNNFFTVRGEGGLTSKEFKLGARIKTINPVDYRQLLINSWESSGYVYLPYENWKEMLESYNKKRKDDYDNTHDSYTIMGDDNKYDDEKRPYPRVA